MAIVIPKETLDNWKRFRSGSDLQALAKKTRKKRSSLYYILRTGKCTDHKLAAQIIKFHNELEKEIEAINKQLDQD